MTPTDPSSPPADRPTARARRWIPCLAANAALVALDFGSLGLLFAGWEWDLRHDPVRAVRGLDMRGIFENDGTGSIRPVPNFHRRVGSESGWIEVDFDSLGLRNPELGPKKPNEKRILALGDSLVFGLGVEEIDTFPEALAARLAAERGAPVRAANAAMVGNGTVELERDLRRTQHSVEPDVVIVGLDLATDFLDDVAGPREVVEGFALSTDAARFIKGSWRGRLALRSRAWFDFELQLADLALRTGLGWLSMGRPEPNETERARTQDFPPPEAREDGIFMDLAAETPQMTRILARTEQALAKLRDLAAPAPVVVLVIPSWRSVFPGEFEAAAARLGAAAPRPAGESQEYLRGLCARRIVEMCGKRLRIAAVDLTEPLRGRSDLYLPQVKHWNPAGHRFVAERLAPVVAPLLAR